MNRLKELQAKKADGSITEAETKELETLEAQASEEVTEVEMTPEIAKQLGEAMKPVISEVVSEAVEAKMADVEGTRKKDIKTPKIEVKSDHPYANLSKEQRLAEGIKALVNRDHAGLKLFNEFSAEAWKQAHGKAGYLNATTDADGGYLVPDPDFVAEVTRLEEQYGVARRNARVRETNSDSVKMNKKASGVTMYEVGTELGTKQGTTMKFGQDLVALRKFAGIAIVSEILDQDSAIDVWQELTTDFAREAARIEDVLVFTDPTTGVFAASGLVALSGGLSADLIRTAPWRVPTQSKAGAKWYGSRSAFAAYDTAKDKNNQYVLNLDNGTLGGYPIEIVEVAEGTAHANKLLFGNLAIASTLISKRGLQLKQLSEATVHDADGNQVNLAEQDAMALRSVIRRNALCRFPGAMAVISGGAFS